MKAALFALCPLMLAAALSSQDMIAVGWAGDVFTLDSRTAELKKIGDGLFGQDATMVDVGGTVWSTSRTGKMPTWEYNLTKVDTKTGMGTIVHKGIPDVRGMARGDANQLWCIVNGNPDSLYVADTKTGVFKRIGSTGVRGLTGLAMHQGKLLAWSLTSGLMSIDRVTGKATDVSSSAAGCGGSGIQFLASRSDGMLIGGKKELYEIHPTTGITKLIGKFGMSIDLRGAEEWYGNASKFGAGCSGAFGKVALSITGTLKPGGDLITTSNNHAASSIGVLVIGASRSAYLSLPLPLNLDPILGTSGCSLLVSFDLILPAMTETKTPANLTMRLVLPTMASGLNVHVQHLVFESVPGGMSWSDAATVHVEY